MSEPPYLRGNVVVDVDGHEVLLELKTMSYATLERIESLRRRDPPGRELVFVVADRINKPARQAIEDNGWGYLDMFDGTLWLRAPGIRIATRADRATGATPPKPAGIVGRAGRVVAYEFLRRTFDGKHDPILTSRSKEEFGLARSSTSDGLRALAAADLLDVTGTPVLPALFWELARVWAPTDRRWLATVPEASEWAHPADPTKPVWRLCGTEAALLHGAPAVTAGDGPVELYVPGPVLLSIATRRYGVADPLSAAASVAVPTAPQVTSPADGDEARHRGWLVVHPVASALDLAAAGDARSLQILAEWQPRGMAVWHDR